MFISFWWTKWIKLHQLRKEKFLEKFFFVWFTGKLITFSGLTLVVVEHILDVSPTTIRVFYRIQWEHGSKMKKEFRFLYYSYTKLPCSISASLWCRERGSPLTSSRSSGNVRPRILKKPRLTVGETSKINSFTQHWHYYNPETVIRVLPLTVEALAFNLMANYEGHCRIREWVKENMTFEWKTDYSTKKGFIS